MGIRGRSALVALALSLTMLGLVAPCALGQQAGVAPPAIPDDSLVTGVETYTGHAANAHRVHAPRIPRHPFMAPNGLSNLHNDAYQSDTYRIGGPLGSDPTTDSALFTRECASITIDSKGRLVTICVGLDRPVLAMLDPDTLEPLATLDLPPRIPGAGSNPFTDFSGGGYFYLDNRNRAVMGTTTRHIFVVGETDGPGFELKRDYDLTSVIASDDKIISALPDWRGRIWFATRNGVVGFLDRHTATPHTLDLAEPIGNSFAVDEKASAYFVTDSALYRLKARRGKVRTIWRHTYPNTGDVKPGQTQAGSGTTPTLLAHGRYVAITDNADPMAVMAFKRARNPHGDRVVCREPVFKKGASDTDQSLTGAGHSLIAENNYGYSIQSTMQGGVTAPGLQRVDIDGDGHGCQTVWQSHERAPSVVPKLSLANGLVYTYTKPPRDDNADAWYLTALDFRTGKTRWSRLAGTGFGFNNNYAPVTLAPNGTAYVGVLGGVTMFRDAAGG